MSVAAVDYEGILDTDERLLKQLNVRLKSCYYYYHHMILVSLSRRIVGDSIGLTLRMSVYSSQIWFALTVKLYHIVYHYSQG